MADDDIKPEDVSLHSLKPAEGSRKDRKRVGRGHGSGHGKTSGRGHKGYGSRSGAKDRARFEGGQNPLHMRMRKLRGPNKKMSMPFEPFRTHTQPVNLDDLEARFDAGAEVTPESLKAAGLATRRDVPVKILGRGELTKKLTVSAHGFSKSAREAIEAAGGTATVIDAASLGGRRALHDPQRLQGPGDPEEAAVHGGAAGPLPARLVHPGPGRGHRGGQGDRRTSSPTAASSTC